MFAKKLLGAMVVPLMALMLAACGAAAATQAPASTQAPVEAPAAEARGANNAAPTAALVDQTGQDANASTTNASTGVRLIVKNADVKLLVKDTDIALDGMTQIVSDTQGYIISSRVWYQDYYGTNYKYATLTMGVPVDQFETALRRLRGLAVRVLDENATGEDVTDQYVDLQSQLTNLEATRERIKSFLDQAKTVDEALRINQQLSDVEAQIEKIKGKMNYFENRAAFSTITVNLEPDLPPVVATPTPTPTPAPVQALGPWDPGRTTRQASRTLVSAYRVIIDLLIWIFVVFIPIFVPPILIIWLIVWLIRKYSKK